MHLCSWSGGCDKWAQFEASYPEPSKITRLLCGGHKDDLVKQRVADKLEELKIKFIGARPSGIKDTQS